MRRLTLPKNGLVPALCGVAIIACLSFAMSAKRKAGDDQERIFKLCSDLAGKWTVEDRNEQYPLTVDRMGNLYVPFVKGGYSQEVRYVSEKRDKIVIATIRDTVESVDEYSMTIGKDIIVLTSRNKTLTWKRGPRKVLEPAEPPPGRRNQTRVEPSSSSKR